MNNIPYKKFHLEFFYELNRMLKVGNIMYSIRKYPKDQVIFLSGSRCQHVGIVTKGEVKIEHLTEAGTRILIRQLKQYDIFGEILLFSPESLYPYDIVAKTNCEVLFISKENLLNILSQNVTILQKYLQHIAESYHQLNKLVKLKSQKTLRHKIAFYFLYYEHLTNNQLN
ncbi:MAG: cyclic nucleotide-binding domain-containing protein, partial [Bacilli bacterium]|nr:cyclic nucleotide-binding domain-containing protein [Bacilli bacterium]